MRKKRIREERCDQRSKKKGVRIGRQSHCSRAEGESEMSTIISSSSTSSLWAAIIQKKNAVMFLLCYRLCNPFRGDISRSSRCSMRSVCSLYVCPALPCLPLPSFNFCIPIIRWMKCYRDRNFFRSYEFFFCARRRFIIFIFNLRIH